MMPKLVRRFWTHFLIAFSENYTLEGFQKTQKKFVLPEKVEALEPSRKREMTICNLFANQNISIREIVRVLDSNLHQVIPILIENGLIKERRRESKRRRKSKGEPAQNPQRSSSLTIPPERNLSDDAPSSRD